MPTSFEMLPMPCVVLLQRLLSLSLDLFFANTIYCYLVIDSSRQMNKAKVHLKKSPRGAAAATAGVFGDNDTVDKEAERAAKLAYQEELKQQVRFLEKCLLFIVAFQLECMSVTHS